MNRRQRWIAGLIALLALSVPLAGVAGAQQADPSTTTSTAPSTTSTTAAPSTTGTPTATPPTTAAPTSDTTDPGSVQTVPDPIPGSYIVTLRTHSKREVLGDTIKVTGRHGGKVTKVWGDALQGYAAQMTPEQAAAVAQDPAVERVEQDGSVHTQTTEAPTPSWGLDRIDQTTGFDNSYTYNSDGAGVHAYVIDTGILITNTDFGGRATVGVDEVGDGRNGIDCAGHGTHVAGTIGGTKYGIAKQAQLVAVRVLDCTGSGSYANVISGINWVAANAIKPAIANMSLGGPKDSALNAAVAGAVTSGVTFAVAAGNKTGATQTGAVTDACESSPASAPTAITVGATTYGHTDTSKPLSPVVDERAAYSYGGQCVDIFAPGSNITSDWIGSNTATNTISGTSMATPHVAGVAALYLAANPCMSPDQVTNALVGNAVTGSIQTFNSSTQPSVTVFDTNSPSAPNQLLNMQFIGPDAPVAPCAAPTAAAANGLNSVHLTWSFAASNGASPITAWNVYKGGSAGAEGPTPFATVTDPTQLSFDDTNVTNGVANFYEISAVNSIGVSLSSNEVSAKGVGLPTAPALYPAVASSNNVDLSWTASASDGGSAITAYKVYRGTSANGEAATAIATLAANANTFSDTAATNGTTWFYKVSAVNAVGETASNEVNAKPTGPPSAPTGLTAAASLGQVKLTWSAPANDGGLPPVTYKVFKSTTSGFTPSGANQVATPSSPTYTDSAVTNGTTYYYLVEATNAGPFDSPPSAQVSATVGQPVDVLVRGLGDGLWFNREANGSTFTGFTGIPGSTSTSNPTMVFDGTAYRGFVRGADGSVFMATSTDGASWSSFQKLGGTILGDPVPASDGNGVVKVFVVGIDLALWVGTVDHGSFQGFARLGGILSAVPGVAYDGSGYQVFVRGNDAGMYSGRLTSAGPGAFGYTARGGILTSSPAVAMDGSAVKVFVRGNDLGLYTASLNIDGSGYSGYSARGGALWSTPELANDGSGVRIVLRGTDNQLWTAKWNSSGSFTGFTPLGGILVNDPVIVADGLGTRVFVVGLGNGLWTGTMKADGTGWTGFTALGGTITAIPAAAAGS